MINNSTVQTLALNNRVNKLFLLATFCLFVGLTAFILHGHNQKPVIHSQANTSIEAPRPLLSESDVALYRDIFLLQKAGDFEEADTLISQLENPLLIGNVLAARYLHADYKTSPEELTLWLRNFSDHAQAKRIAELAALKGVKLNDSQQALILTPLKGRGYTEHLGAQNLPTDWYRGLNAWKNAKYKQAAKYFTNTAFIQDLSPWHKAAAYYWAARAHHQLGQDAIAQDMLRMATEHPMTLYGMLASAALGKPLPVRAASPYISASLEEAPEYMRAKALTLVEKRDLAEAELRNLYSKIPMESRPEVLAMAGALGLGNLQIRLSNLANLSEDEQLFASYPTPQFIIDASHDINPALTLAVIRQESAFNSKAQSPAGAKGLMQVMPQTASHVIKHPQFASLNDAIIAMHGHIDLLRPTSNVKIGASYLGILKDKSYIQSSLVHLLAAYNAGPGNLISWKKAAQNIQDPLLYIESIPFAETRNYVVQVLTHYSIYQALLGQEAGAIQALHAGNFPLYQG